LSWADAPPCKGTPDPKVAEGAGGLIDPSIWQVCSMLPVRFGADMPNAVAFLLRSRLPQAESGGGTPLFGVDLIIVSEGKQVYRFTDLADKAKFFIDDDLRIQNLTANGTNAVLFHSGEVGVSDQWSSMHVVLLPAGEAIAKDAAVNDFGNSWRHRARWIAIRGAPAVLVAKPVEPAGADDPHACHTCPKFYQYFVYRWSARRAAFVVARVAQSDSAIDAETDPFSADKERIQELTSKVAESHARK